MILLIIYVNSKWSFIFTFLHKYQNKLKSHDQCINIYYILFFFIPAIVLYYLWRGVCRANTKTPQIVQVVGVVMQGLTHLGWDFISFLPFYFIQPSASLFFYIPDYLEICAAFYYLEKIIKRLHRFLAGTEVTQGLTHLG